MTAAARLDGEHIAVQPPAADQAARLGFGRADLVLHAAGWMLHDARVSQAEALVRHALDDDADHPDLLSMLASIRERQGDIAGAFAYLDRARDILPDNPRLQSKWIFALDRAPDATLEDALAARRRYNELVRRPLPLRHPNDPDPDRALRVGYVSGDFMQHSAAYGWGPILLKHDPRAFEVYAYHCSTRTDWLTEKFEAELPHFRHCGRMDDDALEAQIRADRIDILVDLAGHSGNNRLPVFARKPAPVQVTAWGYITGTGLDAIDYLLADREIIRPGEQHLFAEEPVWLPRALCYWPPDASCVGEVAPAPCVENGYLTFGVFQQLRKLQPAAVALWAAILARLPSARLVLKSPGLDEAPAQDRIEALFSEHGVALDRVAILGRNDGQNDHMRAYGRIDVALDPWPDGGGISTLEAAYMGVPTLTLPHHQIPSRCTASLNRELGLDALIATDAEDYVARAVRLDGQRERLAAMRPHLRDLLMVSAFCDHDTYVANVEHAYREMWKRWAAQGTHAA